MEHIAFISYGKDSLAMLEAIKILGLDLDRIVTADIWATNTIPGDLPPMLKFKKDSDNIILDMYGIQVEHYRSTDTYESLFYRKYSKGKRAGEIYGFPIRSGTWCNSLLKIGAINKSKKGTKNSISYIGIASDECKRIEAHANKAHVRLPLVEIGWSEAYCRKWCEDNNLLSPIYTNFERGGCWFCHNQSLNQLRTLRNYYPDLWKLLLKWDSESLTTFRSDGKTVHDFDKRFIAEDLGYINKDSFFHWKDLENMQTNIFQHLDNKDNSAATIQN